MSFVGDSPFINAILPSTRHAFDIRSTIIYLLPACLSYVAVAILVLFPGTRPLRIALWPLIAILAFRAAVYVDLSNGDPQSTYLNANFAMTMFTVAIRTLEWTFLKEPLKRHLRPANATPSIFMDALDLATNFRGIGWDWSKSTYVPPENRPASSRAVFCLYILLSAVFQGFMCGVFHIAVKAFSPESFAVLSGGTIFDASLPPLIRYIRSSVITAMVAFVICFIAQFNYSINTLIGIIVFRQEPAQWPPVIQSPWLATSVRDFWSHRWHQLLRRSFIVMGGWPLSFLFGRVGYISGSFLASGIFHYITAVMFNATVEMWCVPFSFGMMAIGIVLEDVFTSLMGRKVGGWKGWLWTMAWLLVWGSMMVDGFARVGMFSSSIALDSASPAQVAHYMSAFDRWLHTWA